MSSAFQKQKAPVILTSAFDISYGLFFVLVDFLEVLVGINLQLAASSFVTSDNAVLMKLKRAYGPSVVNTALNAVTKSASLIVTADKKQYLLRIANGAYANGKRGLGNLVYVVAEETGVNDKGILSQCANACS